MEEQATNSSDLARLAAITPHVTDQLQDFCTLALDTIKVYKPELTRLDQKSDGIIKNIKEINATFSQTLVAHESVQAAEARRTSALEERMSKLEALVAVLPTWKEDLLAKIDSVGKDSRMKTEQLKNRAQVLEEQHAVNSQITRERLDALAQVAHTQANARQAHSDRMDGLERTVRLNEGAASTRIAELEVLTQRHGQDIKANARKLVEHGVQLSMDRIDIDSLTERTGKSESDIKASKSDILVLQDKQDMFQQNVAVLERQLHAQEIAREALGERVIRLERDTRVNELQLIAADYQAFKKKINDYVGVSEQQHLGLMERLKTMDSKIERGPPGLWKLTKQVAAQAAELSDQREILSTNINQLTDLENGLTAAQHFIKQHKDNLAALEGENRVMTEKLAEEIARMASYTDARTKHLSARYEVEALRTALECVKQELQEAIASMGLRVRFELLHDEVPQVNTLKAYIQQNELAVTKAQDRMEKLERTLHQERQRNDSLEADWKVARRNFDALMMDGEFDVPAIRKELQRIRTLFDGISKAASRGEIVSVAQADALIERAMKGPLMEAALTKQLAASKALQQELSSYVQRYELDALRRQLSQATSGAWSSLRPATASAQPVQPLPGQGGTKPVPAKQPAPASLQGEDDFLSPAKPEANTTDSTLMAVYERLAGVEEALSLNTALVEGLKGRLEATQRQLLIATAQLDAEVPPLRQQVSGLTALLVRGGRGAASDAQQAVSKVLHSSVLPEMLDRQAADTKRLLRYIDQQLATTAPAHEVAALRDQLHQLWHQLPTQSEKPAFGPALDAANPDTRSWLSSEASSQVAAEGSRAGSHSRVSRGEVRLPNAEASGGSEPGSAHSASAASAAASAGASATTPAAKLGHSGKVNVAGPGLNASRAARASSGNRTGNGVRAAMSRPDAVSATLTPGSSHRNVTSNTVPVPVSGGGAAGEGVGGGGVGDVVVVPNQPAEGTEPWLEDLRDLPFAASLASQQAAAVRAMTTRVASLEEQLFALQLQQQQQAGLANSGRKATASHPAGLGPSSHSSSPTPTGHEQGDAQHAAGAALALHQVLSDQVAELRALVMQLHVQLPLVAKAYEVEGLRQAMAGLRSDLNTQLQQALAGEVRGGGTSSGLSGAHLHLNITLLPPPPPPLLPPPSSHSQRSGASAAGCLAQQGSGGSGAVAVVEGSHASLRQGSDSGRSARSSAAGRVAQAESSGIAGPSGPANVQGAGSLLISDTPGPAPGAAGGAEQSYGPSGGSQPEGSDELPPPATVEGMGDGDGEEGSKRGLGASQAGLAGSGADGGLASLPSSGSLKGLAPQPSISPSLPAQSSQSSLPGPNQAAQAQVQGLPPGVHLTGEQAMEVMLALDRHFTAQQAHAAALSQRLGCLEVGCGLAEARSKAAEALAAGLESSLQSALSELRLEKVPSLEASVRVLQDQVAALALGLGPLDKLLTPQRLELHLLNSSALQKVLAKAVAGLRSASPAWDTEGSPSLSSPPTSRASSPLSRHRARPSLNPSSHRADTTLADCRDPVPLAVLQTGHPSPNAAPDRGQAPGTAWQGSQGNLVSPAPSWQPLVSLEEEAVTLVEEVGEAGVDAGFNSPTRPKQPGNQPPFAADATDSDIRPTSSSSVPAHLPSGHLRSSGSGQLPGQGAKVRGARMALSARTPRTGSANRQGPSDAAAGPTPEMIDAGLTARHLVTAEHADTELCGLMHDLMHAAHEELKVVKDGPLPGGFPEEAKLGQRSVRDAALARLRLKPYEVQRHVELLEQVKQELDRLVTSAAVSTVDTMALQLIMVDMRVKLLEDVAEQHKDQIGTAYRNLESVFDYLKKLQEAVNTKGSAAVLALVDRALRRLGRAMLDMGSGPRPGQAAGLLFDTPIGSIEHWAPYLGAHEVADAPCGSPPPTYASTLNNDRAPIQVRPATAGPRLPTIAPLPKLVGDFVVVGSPFPPANFMTSTRDILQEQEKVAAALAQAGSNRGQAGAELEGQGRPGSPMYPMVQYSSGGKAGLGIPLVAKTRPAPMGKLHSYA